MKEYLSFYTLSINYIYSTYIILFIRTILYINVSKNVFWCSEERNSSNNYWQTRTRLTTNLRYPSIYDALWKLLYIFPHFIIIKIRSLWAIIHIICRKPHLRWCGVVQLVLESWLSSVRFRFVITGKKIVLGQGWTRKIPEKTWACTPFRIPPLIAIAAARQNDIDLVICVTSTSFPIFYQTIDRERVHFLIQ